MIRPLAVLLMLAATPSTAQHAHSAMGTADAGPSETGQSAFAAIAEIVALLRSDDVTDWEAVDIPALQQHLIDMDLLTTQAVSFATPTSTGAVFEVSGSGEVIDALLRMVPAHAPFLDAEAGWTTEVAEMPDGVVMTVTGDASMIQGLGFHGLMTIGAHHQEHHLMIATGQSPHL
ncbi:hypothetical protein [Gymnodinialimonas sp. 57CJ19]|uniref:hypothetical protein n=1 Tax=Gymnodinialimonas sp. 57CJ19 TaxID=3138498 RepID=UPI0031344F34